MKVTASKLRENVYRLLDQVLATGVPIEIERRGRLLKLVPVEPTSKLAALEPRPFLAAEPESLVHLDWSGEWKP